LALKRAVELGAVVVVGQGTGLTSESVQGAALALEGVDHVHGGHSLPLGVLCVGDCVTDDILQEHLKDPASLLIDQTGDALDSSTAGQTPDGRLGDTLDVVAQHLPVPLGASLAQTLASFSSARHVASTAVRL